MDGTITPAAELASEADGSSSFMPGNSIARPDWTQMMQSYDQDHERQVMYIKDRMQRYNLSSTHSCTKY